MNPYQTALNKVRTQNPLVHHLTNYVTVNDCANITLAIGGSPIMADDLEEVAAITELAQAVVINIGTLNTRTVEAMVLAGKKANQLGIPVILDPVGAGASDLRNQTLARLLAEVHFAVIRGNLSEIRFLAGFASVNQGVDVSPADLLTVQDSQAVAQQLALARQAVVVITGKVDVVSDGLQVALIENGHPTMSRITGTGCMLSSLLGSFCGSQKDYFSASVAATLALGISGEIAHEKTQHQGTGSFRVALLDAVSQLTPAIMEQRGRLQIVKA
ncbi:hydroxyethylthiazole kinase [Enterococcus diestrammenae]|uniref:hydroxyethylthiazole kinase n=1 Tax=Enterococcus diestrammenae TaxID=1155073 RepID=UPI0022E13211|nr:hydroxyethylthiazole kinase [Enterococcus diestrammenae]